ncbi:MAG: flavodoxin family protein [Erysipelotrichaceae bacterium]
MNLILSDKALPCCDAFDDYTYFNLEEYSIAPCMGCFGCWVKTPGRCVIRDDASTIYPLIAQSKRLLYVTKVLYGGYDLPMKTMLERSLPLQQAFIRLVHGEAHHVQRAVAPKQALIIAYGCEDSEEQAIFRQYIARNALNVNWERYTIVFAHENEIEAFVLQEVSQWNKR